MNKGLRDFLVSNAKSKISDGKNLVHYTGEKEIDNFINDIKNYPHAFLTACLMDKRIQAERAWEIPYKIKEDLGDDFSMKKLLSISIEEYKALFETNELHTNYTEMSKVFYEAIQKIHKDYNDDASNIWNNKPDSATLIRRIREFYGAGPKIASMTANILVRQFGIELSDNICIDISVDTHVKRVFTRLGLVPEVAENEDIINVARTIYPEYPGILDYSIWNIGRNYCYARKKPNCSECDLNQYCAYNKKEHNI